MTMGAGALSGAGPSVRCSGTWGSGRTHVVGRPLTQGMSSELDSFHGRPCD
jgi:hypothetical protein